jgi:hypothetical protein
MDRRPTENLLWIRCQLQCEVESDCNFMIEEMNREPRPSEIPSELYDDRGEIGESKMIGIDHL